MEGSSEIGMDMSTVQVSPKKDIVFTETKKTPKDTLSEAVKDPNISADALLDVFDNCVENIQDYSPDDVDMQVLLNTELPMRIINDAGFDPKITDLESADDPRLEGFPERIKDHIKWHNEGNWGHSQYKKFPEDPKWSRFWKLIGKYERKVVDIVSDNPEILRNMYSGTTDAEKIGAFESRLKNLFSDIYELRLNDVKEKGIGKDLVASGEWLGHGTFVSNLEKMLEHGGKFKSTYHVMNSGQSREDILGDIKGGDAHKAFIFFYHWKKEDYKYPIDTVGRYGTKINGKQTISDLSIFYPVDTIYRNGLTIGSYMDKKSTSEFFATKSPEFLNGNDKLLGERIKELAMKDQTELPLDQGFYRVNDPVRFQEVKALFTKFGYTKEWIKDHVYYQEIGSDRNSIREWLKSRTYTKVQIPELRPVESGENSYFWKPANV